MRIRIQVDGAWIKSFANSAREAYEGLSRAINMLGGEIEDPDRAKRSIREFYELRGNLHIEDLIASWTDMTDDSQEAFEIVSGLIREFGSADQIAFVESERGKAYIMTEICRLHGKIA